MTEMYEPPAELVDWATKAGMSFRREEGGKTAVFVNPGREFRFVIRTTQDRLIRITSASKGEAESYEADACSAKAADAFFWMSFGSAVRARLRLPILDLPLRKAV